MGNFQKSLRQTNFRRSSIFTVSRVCTSTKSTHVYATVCMCACVYIVVRILRSGATARHHVCRNIRFTQGRIRSHTYVRAHQRIPIRTQCRRESHTWQRRHPHTHTIPCNLRIYSRASSCAILFTACTYVYLHIRPQLSTPVWVKCRELYTFIL